jgi:pectate lyase
MMLFNLNDQVMLLGHCDKNAADTKMQVTVAFNHFAEGCVQRMPRCRYGFFHVVNNDYTKWKMYAIGGTSAPTIVSQGNRFTAPDDPNSKDVCICICMSSITSSNNFI